MTQNDAENIFGFCLWVIVVGGMYFLPFAVALIKRHKQLGAVFALNFFAGWTGIGWLGSLIWAAIGTTPGINQKETSK